MRESQKGNGGVAGVFSPLGTRHPQLEISIVFRLALFHDTYRINEKYTYKHVRNAMNTQKLTLSVPGPIVADARRLSKRRGESISSMFSRFVEASARELVQEDSLPPKTRRALQLAIDVPPVPADLDWRALRDGRLAERYAP